MTETTDKIVLPVEGMTCAACQATVQRALTKAPGVEKAAVNLMTNEATVHYDPSTTSPDALVNAINDTGYVARLPQAASVPTAEDDAADRHLAAEYAALRTKATVSFALGVLAMFVSMPLMHHGGHTGDPLIARTMEIGRAHV